MRNFTSIELDAFSGASVAYSIVGESGETEFKTKSPRPVHPDFRDLFITGLKKRVTWLLGFPEEAEEIVVPTGVAFPSATTVVYSAIIKGPKGNYKAKTPKIKINELEDRPILDEIIKEADAYVDGKSAELSIFGE